MKKIFFGTLAAVCLIMLIMPAVQAEEYINYAVTGGNIQFDRESKAVRGCDYSVTEANIPDTIAGVSVTHIYPSVF